MPRDRAPRHPRLTPCRPDLAAAALAGEVAAPRFVAGWPVQIGAAIADLRRAPRPDAPLDTQAFFGAAATCFDVDEGWAWVQLADDGYVGYVPSADVVEGWTAPTHIVAVARTFVYPRPDLKAPPASALPLAAAAAVVAREGAYARLQGGAFVFAAHLRALNDAPDIDFVAVAERLIGTPYLWGGVSPLGIDCSGLVQLALRMTGRIVKRDTDMQEESLGTAMPPGAALQRGDLVFWSGHVGLLRDPETLLHANAHHMSVASEPLATARARIAAAGGGAVRAVRRP